MQPTMSPAVAGAKLFAQFVRTETGSAGFYIGLHANGHGHTAPLQSPSASAATME
jgi:hypothetical protein